MLLISVLLSGTIEINFNFIALREFIADFLVSLAVGLISSDFTKL